MVEKNYDPDNDNCPEKEMVENLRKSKLNSDKNQAKEFTDNSSNRLSKDKNELQNNTDSNDKKDKTKDLEDNKN